MAKEYNQFESGFGHLKYRKLFKTEKVKAVIDNKADKIKPYVDFIEPQ